MKKILKENLNEKSNLKSLSQKKDSDSNLKILKKEKKVNKKQKKETLRWFIIVCILTFILSLSFSYVSSLAVNGLNILLAILILLLVIFIGIVFDIIGVAVTVGEEHDFHAKATKKVKGSKTALKLIKKSAKVANVCADVIGDICGVLSGAISATIAMKVMNQFNLSFDLQFIISALVASLTVGGKAIGKTIAQEHSTAIIHFVSRVLSVFQR